MKTRIDFIWWVSYLKHVQQHYYIHNVLHSFLKYRPFFSFLSLFIINRIIIKLSIYLKESSCDY